MTVGIKISLPTKDVRTCTPKDCSLHSEYSAFKARTIGSTTLTANTWKEISHNYGYEPAYFGWFTGNFGGVSGIAPIGGAPIVSGSASSLPYVESYVTTSKLFLRSNVSTTVYYYIFADLAGSISGNVPIPDYGEFGLMITKPNVNVLEAKPYQLNFLSTYPNFKVHSEPFKEFGAIDKTPTTHHIYGDSGATTLRFDNANKYGRSGEIMIFNHVTVDTTVWKWTGWDESDWEYVELDDSTVKQDLTIYVKSMDGSQRKRGKYENGSWKEGDAKMEGEKFDRKYYWREHGSASWQEGVLDEAYYYENDYDKKAELWSYDWVSGEYINEFRNEKVSFTSTDSQYFYGCTRGIDGTTRYHWDPGAYIQPITSVYEVANRPTSYNPAFLAWSLGIFELEITAFPQSTGYSQYQIVLSGSKFYLVSRHSWSGDMSWATWSQPQFVPTCYLKIMHDEIGT